MDDRAAMFMFGMAVLFLVYQFALRMIRCRYCGGVGTHEPHCPYANSGLTGGSK
jgi:hypothetical protein